MHEKSPSKPPTTTWNHGSIWWYYPIYFLPLIICFLFNVWSILFVRNVSKEDEASVTQSVQHIPTIESLVAPENMLHVKLQIPNKYEND
jgi:hypothetical protein